MRFMHSQLCSVSTYNTNWTYRINNIKLMIFISIHSLSKLEVPFVLSEQSNQLKQWHENCIPICMNVWKNYQEYSIVSKHLWNVKIVAAWLHPIWIGSSELEICGFNLSLVKDFWSLKNFFGLFYSEDFLVLFCPCSRDVVKGVLGWDP